MTAVPDNWNAAQLPDLRGRTIIVTGANSGIGYHTALELGRSGAEVILACRDPHRGATAWAELKTAAPDAAFRVEQLDLAVLRSVRNFADRFLATGQPLDVLINNAGVMALPERELTYDGFEQQFGTNVLGPFALTALLAPALRRSPSPRVVTISSLMAYVGRIELDNLQGEKRYSPARAYAQSKLANILFMLELGRRAPWLLSVAAHPGASRTNITRHRGLIEKFGMRLLGQDAAAGALPSLYAATGPATSGDFFGPARRFHSNGPPTHVKLPKRASDPDTAQKLWQACDQLTNLTPDLAEQRH